MTSLTSEITNWLLVADQTLMLFFNGMHNAFFDKVMWVISSKYFWVPFYVLLAFYFVRRLGWRRALVCILLIGLVVTLVDQTCSHLIRPIVQRMRPSNPDNPLSQYIHIVNVYRGGRFGFPSCHAANCFSLAILTAVFMRVRWLTATMFAWAVTVSYSRIYLGVHYPGDLLSGFLVASVYASAIGGLYIRYSHRPLPLPRFFRLPRSA